jgi:hypothetical protein
VSYHIFILWGLADLTACAADCIPVLVTLIMSTEEGRDVPYVFCDTTKKLYMAPVSRSEIL